MRHVIVDDWSRRNSPLHRMDARAKLLSALAIVVAIGVADPSRIATFVAAAALLGCALGVAALPARQFALRVAIVLLFCAPFIVLLALMGETSRAVAALLRASLSTATVLLLASTTPFPELASALRAIRVPALLVSIIEFVHRYLFVAGEQLWRMRNAAAARCGSRSALASTGIAAVLFGKSMQRAEAIHRAMLARGFSGSFPRLQVSVWTWRDSAALVLTAALLLLSFLPPVRWNH